MPTVITATGISLEQNIKEATAQLPRLGLSIDKATGQLETIEAYRDHSDTNSHIEQDIMEADWIMAQLPRLDISIDKATRYLEDEGVKKFNEPFDKLMEALTVASIVL